MEPWPRNRMKILSPGTYNFNFRNLLEAPGRNFTYLCFEVENEEHFYSGVFKNQVYPEEPLHTEVCFLDWFQYTILDVSPDEKYQVTWYVSWSPCCECAEQVAEFLEAHENVRLRIFVSRLYYCDYEDEQQGLRRLVRAGAQLDIMSPEDFEYCWNNFVDHCGWNFRYWKWVRRNYETLVDELNEILGG